MVCYLIKYFVDLEKEISYGFLRSDNPQNSLFVLRQFEDLRDNLTDLKAHDYVDLEYGKSTVNLRITHALAKLKIAVDQKVRSCE